MRSLFFLRDERHPSIQGVLFLLQISVCVARPPPAASARAASPPMPPPPVQPREPPAAPSSAAGPPSPEFMWCQRSDRVYVTIKVADCVRAAVHVNDGELSFSGHGHGARGTRDYALSLRLAGAVVPSRCCWFVCGPSVRVRLEKEAAGPYWDSLMVGVKPPQCKIDWQSWIDEDEECEVSAAPSGFEANDLQMQMVGQSIEFYRDESRLTSSEEARRTAAAPRARPASHAPPSRRAPLASGGAQRPAPSLRRRRERRRTL